MPGSVDELLAVFDLESIEDGLFRAQPPPTLMQRVFGGQVLGQALLAASRTVPPERSAHSLHAYFLVGGDPAVPIVYDVENLRDGRSFSARRVAVRQHGRHIFYLTASFQIPEVGPEHQDLAPDVPLPHDCPTLAQSMANTRDGTSTAVLAAEFAALDVRYAGSSAPGGALADPAHPALARIWMKAGGRLPDDDTLHRCVLTYMSDLTLLHASLVPHPMDIDATQRASIDHAMWFHRPFRADEWLLYDQVSPFAGGARGLAIGRIFDANGSLVATAVQEGLIRPGAGLH
ncbi:MAG TPA: acyl-CoA thioesterase II [Sporichthyaceae bacterium]|jgi:acyl-CoA thioesterase-2|nr:acyl-CoA thioesterase II [Sporichthyaceae bacterium]